MAFDSLHRYLFESANVRGELVQLSDSYQGLIQGKPYPQPIAQLLGEMMAATSLLAATLKFQGQITVQIQGDGPVSLLVINSTHKQVMRGTARWSADLPTSTTLPSLLGKGQMTITLISDKNDKYQGIVSIEHDSLEACLEEYFERSEQLKTKLWLRAGSVDGKPVAAGMLLQVLPEDNGDNNEFEHLVQLTHTIKDAELFTLDANTLLYRLYHQEHVKLFEPAAVSYACTCSHERSALALQAIGESEVAAMQLEDGSLTLDCDYCGKAFRFEPLQLKEIFAPIVNKTLH